MDFNNFLLPNLVVVAMVEVNLNLSASLQLLEMEKKLKLQKLLSLILMVHHIQKCMKKLKMEGRE